MLDHDVSVLMIGAGPANLALAAAIEESGSPEVAASTLMLEQYPDVQWQRNLLMPWARSQVSFLKDLVTLRNPRSKFSYLNFLHEHGRLDRFVNLGTFNPYRWEFSDYLQWVAKSLECVGIRYGARASRIEPARDANGWVAGWVVSLSDGSTIRCRDLVVGGGREAHVPDAFTGLPTERVIHSTQFRNRIGQVPADRPLRVVVVGGAQSAAEMFVAARENLPQAELTMVVRSVGLQNYQTSKFVNELFYPSFQDTFYQASPRERSKILDEMRFTNYAGVAPPFLEEIYAMLYREDMLGPKRSTMRPMTEVVASRVQDGEVVLDLRDRTTDKVEPLACDVVLLGTGYDPCMPWLVRDLAAKLCLSEVSVTRNFRVRIDGPARGALYLQGVNEQTHGIADSLISVLASRSADILADLLARRAETAVEDVVAEAQLTVDDAHAVSAVDSAVGSA